MPNNGGWYDFGYFLGIVVFGVGARKSQIVYRDRNVIDVKAKRVEELRLMSILTLFMILGPIALLAGAAMMIVAIRSGVGTQPEGHRDADRAG